MKKESEEVITRHIGPLAKRLGWKADLSGDGSKDYSSGAIRVRVLDDGGSLKMMVGPALHMDQALSVSEFKDTVDEPAPKGHWQLSIEEQCAYIEEIWEWLGRVMTEEGMRRILHALRGGPQAGLQRGGGVLAELGRRVSCES